MPDGGLQQQYQYRRAVREKTAPLIMIAGPPGVGKTYSALRLARGFVGPAGKIFLADTDNGRAQFYAEEFEFLHLNLREPFRPMVFEAAAIAAQKQGADALIVDNFMHEHAGPGGLLDWHQEVNIRMARGDPARMETTKVLAWAEIKPAHKRMRERLYQLNMMVILCCGAERKIAMKLQTEGKNKGKVVPVDQGFVPICGSDIPWNMTISVLLGDVERPGVPTPIKALLPALKPIVSLDRPLDEETGARIAAWARGDKATVAHRSVNETQSATLNKPAVNPGQTSEPPPAGQPQESVGESPPEGKPAENETPSPPPPKGGSVDSGGTAKPDKASEIVDGLLAAFAGTKTRKEHLVIVDAPKFTKQMDWLKEKRPEDHDRVSAAVKDSWKRTEPQQGTPT